MNEDSHTHHSSGAGKLKAHVGWAAGMVLWARGKGAQTSRWFQAVSHPQLLLDARV